MTQSISSTELRSVLGDLVQTNHRLTRLAARSTGSTESPATWRTLSVLMSSGPLRLGELAEASRVSQPTMTKIVRGLAESDLVKRIADSADARAWQIDITPAGLRALEAWRDELAAALEPLFHDLDDSDVQVLRKAVAILSSRVGESRPTGEPALLAGVAR